MAAGTWHIQYAFAVFIKTETYDGTTLVAVNTAFNTPEMKSLNGAVGSCMAFIRRFQSIGIDSRGEVHGKPIGANATAPAVALASGFQDEEIYATLDTPDHDLLRAISLANRDMTGSSLTVPSGDLAEDISALA